jgi:hypothetical protein
MIVKVLHKTVKHAFSRTFHIVQQAVDILLGHAAGVYLSNLQRILDDSMHSRVSRSTRYGRFSNLMLKWLQN